MRVGRETSEKMQLGRKQGGKEGHEGTKDVIKEVCGSVAWVGGVWGVGGLSAAAVRAGSRPSPILVPV